MSKRAIENYIPKAIEVLKNEFVDGEIPSAYNGYISSFGASVMQSGLKPTLALFENRDANTKEKKYKLTKLILKILDQNYNEESLLTYLLENIEREHILKQKIIDIAVALKLSIRTFKLKKDDNADN